MEKITTRHNNLILAKQAKNDEFYTQWADIDKEINAYLDFNPNVFKDKTILCPCDDPEWSNFTKYFALNFQKFGLKKLISTSYAPNSNGKIAVVIKTDIGNFEVDNLYWDYLDGDGDFRSDEVTALRDEADMIITNPPFSLFREFIPWIMEGQKQFLVIGNMNAITYKEIFPLIMENKMWLGATNFNQGMYFRVPDGFTYADTYKFERERDGIKVNRVSGVCWFTNIDHGRRNQPLPLMTMADNLKFNKKLKGKNAYVKYDNYDAIEVPFVDAIPSDYDGVMGVPISFLDKYCPEQFEIVAFRKGDDGKDLVYTVADIEREREAQEREFVQNKVYDELITGRDGGMINGKSTYKRLFIRKVKVWKK